MFSSLVRELGDVAGVFEYVDDTGYFYLCMPSAPEGQGILGAIWITSAIQPDFDESDIDIRWDSEEQMVGLSIRGVLCAVFDATTKAPFGGAYDNSDPRPIPTAVRARFS